MHYFTRGDETAVAETAASAAQLERDGFTRCTPAEHELAWAERDRLRRLEMAREDAPPCARQEQALPIAPGPTVERGGKVYASSMTRN